MPVTFPAGGIGLIYAGKRRAPFGGARPVEESLRLLKPGKGVGGRKKYWTKAKTFGRLYV